LAGFQLTPEDAESEISQIVRDLFFEDLGKDSVVQKASCRLDSIRRDEAKAADPLKDSCDSTFYEANAN